MTLKPVSYKCAPGLICVPFFGVTIGGVSIERCRAPSPENGICEGQEQSSMAELAFPCEHGLQCTSLKEPKEMEDKESGATFLASKICMKPPDTGVGAPCVKAAETGCNPAKECPVVPCGCELQSPPPLYISNDTVTGEPLCCPKHCPLVESYKVPPGTDISWDCTWKAPKDYEYAPCPLKSAPKCKEGQFCDNQGSCPGGFAAPQPPTNKCKDRVKVNEYCPYGTRSCAESLQCQRSVLMQAVEWHEITDYDTSRCCPQVMIPVCSDGLVLNTTFASLPTLESRMVTQCPLDYSCVKPPVAQAGESCLPIYTGVDEILPGASPTCAEGLTCLTQPGKMQFTCVKEVILEPNSLQEGALCRGISFTDTGATVVTPPLTGQSPCVEGMHCTTLALEPGKPKDEINYYCNAICESSAPSMCEMICPTVHNLGCSASQCVNQTGSCCNFECATPLDTVVGEPCEEKSGTCPVERCALKCGCVHSKRKIPLVINSNGKCCPAEPCPLDLEPSPMLYPPPPPQPCPDTYKVCNSSEYCGPTPGMADGGNSCQQFAKIGDMCMYNTKCAEGLTCMEGYMLDDTKPPVMEICCPPVPELPTCEPGQRVNFNMERNCLISAKCEDDTALGGRGDVCNESINPPKACKEGLQCYYSDIYTVGGNGECVDRLPAKPGNKCDPTADIPCENGLFCNKTSEGSTTCQVPKNCIEWYDGCNTCSRPKTGQWPKGWDGMCAPDMADLICLHQQPKSCKVMCEIVKCKMFCLEGWAQDKDGCDICECATVPTTPKSTTTSDCIEVTCADPCKALAGSDGCDECVCPSTKETTTKVSSTGDSTLPTKETTTQDSNTGKTTTQDSNTGDSTTSSSPSTSSSPEDSTTSSITYSSVKLDPSVHAMFGAGYDKVTVETQMGTIVTQQFQTHYPSTKVVSTAVIATEAPSRRREKTRLLLVFTVTTVGPMPQVKDDINVAWKKMCSNGLIASSMEMVDDADVTMGLTFVPLGSSLTTTLSSSTESDKDTTLIIAIAVVAIVVVAVIAVAVMLKSRNSQNSSGKPISYDNDVPIDDAHASFSNPMYSTAADYRSPAGASAPVYDVPSEGYLDIGKGRNEYDA